MITNRTISSRIIYVSLFISSFVILYIVATKQFDTNTNAFIQKSIALPHDKNIGNPVRLQIPKLGIDAFVQNIGVTSTGIMETPNNNYDVGWFKLGPKPSQLGSAVIAGHYNGAMSASGIFANLHLLKKGDMVYTIDTFGNTKTFVVRTSELFNEGYADGVFSSNDAAHLNLITCDGDWNTQTQSYTKRLVVFTDLAI